MVPGGIRRQLLLRAGIIDAAASIDAVATCRGGAISRRLPFLFYRGLRLRRRLLRRGSNRRRLRPRSIDARLPIVSTRLRSIDAVLRLLARRVVHGSLRRWLRRSRRRGRGTLH